MTLLQIIAATAMGGVVSVLLAAALSLTWLAAWAPRLVSYAVGVLLGTTFLDLLPEAVNRLGPEDVLATCLGGVLAFFALEKAALWRHAHAGDGHGHGDMPGASLILLGDAMHNFVDGVLIAAAFLVDASLGWAAAIAVLVHEVPQEVGDFAILLEAGFSRGRALAWNALSGAAAVVGGLAGWAALSAGETAIPYALAVSAASFLYVAIADLMPLLQRRSGAMATLQQFALIGLGVATVAGLHAY